MGKRVKQKNKAPLLRVDECLVARVEAKKNGADVHEVSSWLSLYVCNIVTYNRWATRTFQKMTKKDAEWCKATSREAERVLRAFEVVGNIWVAAKNVTEDKSKD
jgi:hypothetical protein